MTLAPLSPSQRAAIDGFIAAGRLRVVPSDAMRALRFLAIADERLGDIPGMNSPVVRYGVAYDAAHDVGEAFLASYGYATANGPGQHAALADFIAVVIDAPPGAAAAAGFFEQARRARNGQNYRAAAVGAEQAEAVVRMAVALRTAAADRGVGQ